MPCQLRLRCVPELEGGDQNVGGRVPLQDQVQEVGGQDVDREERARGRGHHQREVPAVQQRADALPHAAAQIGGRGCHGVLHVHGVRVQVQNQQLRAGQQQQAVRSWQRAANCVTLLSIFSLCPANIIYQIFTYSPTSTMHKRSGNNTTKHSHTSAS